MGNVVAASPWLAPLTLGAGAVLSWGIAIVAARRATIPGARALVLLMAAVGLWKAARAAEWLASGRDVKIAWAKVEYLGIATVPLLLFLFASAYCGQRVAPSRRTLLLLWAMPAATFLVAATNEWHGLIWPRITSSGPDPQAPLVYAHGPWFWGMVVFNYTLLLASGGIILWSVIRYPAFYRGQAGAMLVGIALPWLGNVLYLTGHSPIEGLDPTPFAIALAGAIWFVVVSRRRLLDLIPVARETMIEQLEDGILVIDAQDRIVDANAAARHLLGGDGTLVGQALAAITVPTTLRDAIARRERFHAEVHLAELSDGRHIEVRGTPLKGRGAVHGRLVQLRDITARKRAEAALHTANARLQAQLAMNERLQAQLREDAIRDALTECFNRRHLLETLAGDVERAAARGEPLSIVLLDVDHFKQINDRFGHRAGDRALQQVAAVLRVQVREGGAVYRYGGEEFVVVLPGATAAVAWAHAEGWQRAVHVITVRDGDDAPAHITFSAGIATFPDHGTTDDDLLIAADTALYDAKHGGRNRIFAAQPRPQSAPRRPLRLVV